MKSFNKFTLGIFKVLAYILLSKKEIFGAVKEYNDTIENGKRKFSNLIIKYGYKSGSADNKRISELYSTAIIFRNNKKLVKKVLGQIMFFPFIVGLLTIPFFVPCFLYSTSEFTWIDIIINYLISYVSIILFGLVLIPFFDVINNFEIKIGKTLNILILFILLTLFCSSGYLFYKSYSVAYIGIFSAYLIVYTIILMYIIEYIFELLIDSYYFSYKVHITDALILESSYSLTLILWNEAIKKRNLRQTALTEIERLASLIEKDWSSHILPGDEKTNKWKNNTLIGIASSIRKNKRLVIIPAVNTPVELKANFDLIFEKIIKHDIQGLIDEEVPVIRIKKKSRSELIQSFIVALLPLSISLCLKYLPIGVIDSNYIHLSILISSIWLLLSALLWLDPNLSDKISTFKSVKDVLKPGDNN